MVAILRSSSPSWSSWRCRWRMAAHSKIQDLHLPPTGSPLHHLPSPPQATKLCSVYWFEECWTKLCRAMWFDGYWSNTMLFGDLKPPNIALLVQHPAPEQPESIQPQTRWRQAHVIEVNTQQPTLIFKGSLSAPPYPISTINFISPYSHATTLVSTFSLRCPFSSRRALLLLRKGPGHAYILYISNIQYPTSNITIFMIS